MTARRGRTTAWLMGGLVAIVAAGAVYLVLQRGLGRNPSLADSKSKANSSGSRETGTGSNRVAEGPGSARGDSQAAVPETATAHANSTGPFLLRDATDSSGITFRHTDGSSGRKYIMETVTAGLALFDYDGDGDIDIYFVNGAPLQGTVMDTVPKNALYRNDGGFHFTDVTEEAGVGDPGFGLGVAIGDYDNDGAPDIFVNNYGYNVMYHNNGDGTFAETTKVTRTAGKVNHLGAGASFLDADGDGDLDLYVASYMNVNYKDHHPEVRRGYHVYPGPLKFPPVTHEFYRNNGDGTFTEVSREVGIAAHLGRGMGLICSDYDDDGDTDIFVANDSSANFLFQNDGTGKFQEVGTLAGVAYDRGGLPRANMGVDYADYDRDGRFDFYVTTYEEEWSGLYRNVGGGLFDDVVVSSGAGIGTKPHVKWGTAFVDFDNDGFKDLYVACGHLYDNVDLFSDSTSYLVRNVVLRNTGDGKFVDVSEQSGDGMLPKLSSRGAAFDDLDNDGDIDGVILNLRSPSTVIRNDSVNDHHWLHVRLIGVNSNRDGVGARVKVVVGGVTLLDEVHSGRGYQGHFGSRLHFGLGQLEAAKSKQIDRLEVRWIGGETDVLENVELEKIVTIVEGTSQRGNSGLSQ